MRWGCTYLIIILICTKRKQKKSNFSGFGRRRIGGRRFGGQTFIFDEERRGGPIEVTIKDWMVHKIHDIVLADWVANIVNISTERVQRDLSTKLGRESYQPGEI